MSALTAPLFFIKDQPIAVAASVISYVVIGMLWYGPLFRKPWAKLTGMDKVPKNKMKKQMFSAMTVSVSSAFVQASVLGTILSVVEISSYLDLLSLLLLLWFPFTATVIATNYAYTMKPVKLLLIDAVFPLVTWTAMAFIFVFVQM